MLSDPLEEDLDLKKQHLEQIDLTEDAMILVRKQRNDTIPWIFFF